MKLKKGIKGIALGIGLYLGIYTAVSGCVAYDYLKYQSKKIEQEQPVSCLDIHKYKVTIDGKEKHFTLAGEIHFYNKTENKIAKELVKQHKYFANEVGTDSYDNTTLSNKLFAYAIFTPSKIPLFYYKLGSGRTYDDLFDIVAKQGFRIYAIEDPNKRLNTMNFGEKTLFVEGVVLSVLTAPILYYDGKNEKLEEESQDRGNLFKKSLINKRDVMMADGIINLLKKDEVDSLLVTFGKAHLKGVTRNLSNLVELEELK